MIQVFIDALHGEEVPIGRVFISYAREDKTIVHNVLVDSLESRGIPYFIDERDVGINRTTDRILSLVDDSACGIVVLSHASLDSRWLWYETGLMVGRGKRILPFSLVNGEPKAEFIRSLPDFVREYNIVDLVSDLLPEVRSETFVAGRLAQHHALRDDIFSELKTVEIELQLDDLADGLAQRLTLGVLLVKFGREEALAQVSEIDRRDAALLNVPFPARSQRDDAALNRIRTSFSLPVHKTLGVQFKMYADVSEVALVEELFEYLGSAGAVDVGRAGSAERQRVYFLVDHPALQIVSTSDDIKNHFLYPV